MQVGFIGLGRMGQIIVQHVLEGGVDVVGYNRTSEKANAMSSKLQSINQKLGKFVIAFSLTDLVKNLQRPRVIWMMVKSGGAVDATITSLLPHLTKGDILIDGGNSFYKDSVRRQSTLSKKGIHYLDIGTSGGVESGKNGACLMVGGDKKIFENVRPILDIIAKPSGSVTYFGESGAGHFVKMIHNGVEYGLMQAIGEGYALLAQNDRYKIDLLKVAKSWSRGSIVRGYLMELLARALRKDPHLDKILGVAGGGETGNWTVETAKEFKIPLPVIEQSVRERKKSALKPQFSTKVVAALREEFGGHEIKKV